MKIVRQCQACGLPFEVRPQTPGQRFCPAPECQRRRRREWQRRRLATDADYRENQAQAQRSWVAGHPEYWREYRELHPAYAARNREQQKRRNVTNRIAKMDVWKRLTAVRSGIYALSPAPQTLIAKMDPWIVRITVLARESADRVMIAKRGRVTPGVWTC
ncbi:hypothetical protein D9M68_728490 [compost metagenome]